MGNRRAGAGVLADFRIFVSDCKVERFEYQESFATLFSKKRVLQMLLSEIRADHTPVA
jgi:hypothetical protein